MLRNITDLYANRLIAADGDIGHVQDFYFDDQTWVVRYLVVNTGTWLTGRLVLLSPHAFGGFDEVDGKAMLVNLTRKQIEASPSIETHQPVSRQYEVEYYKYYGWPTYWTGDAIWGQGGFPMAQPPARPEWTGTRHHHRDSKHLQSSKAVIGYHLQALDGIVGHVSGYLVNDKDWAIHHMLVKPGHWYSGREISIPTDQIQRISYEESLVIVNLTKAELQALAKVELAQVSAEADRTSNFSD